MDSLQFLHYVLSCEQPNVVVMLQIKQDRRNESLRRTTKRKYELYGSCDQKVHAKDNRLYYLWHRRRTCEGYFPNSLQPITYLGVTSFKP